MRLRTAILSTLALGMLPASAGTISAQPDLSTVEGRYAHVTSKLDAGGVFFNYVDMDGLADLYFEAGEKFLAVLQEQTPDPEAQNALGQVLEKGGPLYNYLGISAVRGFGASSVPDGDGYLNRSFISIDRTRLDDRPMVLGGEPRPRKGLHLAPEQTQLFVSADLSLRNAIQIVYDIAAITHPGEGAAQIDQGFEMAQAFTTVPWKEALQSLEGEMIAAVWADDQDWRKGGTDQDPIEYPAIHYLVALQSSDTTLHDGLLNWAQMQTFTVEPTESGDVTISTLVPPNFLKDAPRISLARDETFTYFASEPAVLSSALERLAAESGGLASSAEFQRMRSGFPAECNAVLFVNKSINDISIEFTRRNIPDGEENAARLVDTLQEIGSQLSAPISTLAVGVQQPDGVLFTSRGPKSGRAHGLMTTSAAFGVMAAIAVPNFIEARGRAIEARHRQACRENQYYLARQFGQYMQDNNITSVAEGIEGIGGASQTTPADGSWVGTLIGPDHYIRFEPVCPSGGVYTFNDTDANPDLPPVTCSQTRMPGIRPQVRHDFPTEGIR